MNQLTRLDPKPYLGDFFGGEFHRPQQPSGHLQKHNPGDIAELVWEGLFEFEHVTKACESARRAFVPWASLPLKKREEFLLRLKEAYISRSEELAEAISRETGKPVWESQTEVQSMINKIDITIQDALPLVAEREVKNAVGGISGFLRFKPRGVMAVIGPFNFPGHLPNGHFVPALLTGNTVVFKPSELTPLVGQIMAQCFEFAGFPPGVFNMVQGPGEIGKRLAMNEVVEGVLFTGSYETGYRIKQDTLPHFWKICALEMGGKNAALVWDDCDIRHAVYETIVGAFITAGQRCSATSKIIVRKSVADKFLASFHDMAKKLTIGYAFNNPFMGPLINAAALDKYLRFQGIAKRENCEPIMRGKALDLEREGYYVTPSINLIPKLNPESVYQKSELFGPNVAVYIVEDISEAQQIITTSSYGLALSVFSNDQKFFDKCLGFSRVGVMNWNRSTVGASSRLPFGGMGKSGNNQPTGTFAVYTCTYPVSSLQDPHPKLPEKLFPGLSHPI